MKLYLTAKTNRMPIIFDPTASPKKINMGDMKKWKKVIIGHAWIDIIPTLSTVNFPTGLTFNRYDGRDANFHRDIHFYPIESQNIINIDELKDVDKIIDMINNKIWPIIILDISAKQEPSTFILSGIDVLNEEKKCVTQDLELDPEVFPNGNIDILKFFSV